MLEKYVNFTQIYLERRILSRHFNFREFPSKTYFRLALACQRKSSQMNANCIRCVAIAGVCKRQNCNCQKFSARKLFMLRESFVQREYIGRNVAESMKSRQCMTYYFHKDLSCNPIPIFPDFRIFPFSCIIIKFQK